MDQEMVTAPWLTLGGGQQALKGPEKGCGQWVTKGQWVGWEGMEGGCKVTSLKAPKRM